MALVFAGLPQLVMADEATKHEALTSRLLLKVRDGEVKAADLLDVNVVMRGEFEGAAASQAGLGLLMGCNPAPASARPEPVIWPQDRGSLSGKAVVVVDALLDCTNRKVQPGFARATTFFEGQRLFMIVVRAGKV